jgi:ribosomal protein S6
MAETKKIKEELVYELGIHLVSDEGEDKIKGSFENIKKEIEGLKGKILSEESPRLMPLAYTIIKQFQGRNFRYSQAYFGWIKFDMEKDQISDLKTTIDAMPENLRSMIIKTTKEHVMHGPKFSEKRESKRYFAPEEAVKVEVKDEIVVPLSTDEEVDKVIDELVA